MSDAKGAPGDPSMEDILASIRRIIADDETHATVPARSADVPPAESRGPEDVLLLTDLVEEPGKNVPSSPPDQTRQNTEGLVEAAVRTHMPTNRTKDDLPVEGARESVNPPGRDRRTGEGARGPSRTTAEERGDRRSQAPRADRRKAPRRTTL